jgi:ABC-type glycerol-3-phosphate transport system permease component
MNTDISMKNKVSSTMSSQPADGLKIFAWIALVFWMLMIVGVLAIAVSFSFKSSVEIFQNPWSPPSTIKTALRNYLKAWSTSQMGVYLFNSLLIVSTSLIITLVVSSMAAYILARFRFLGRNLLKVSLVLGMGVPLQLMLIPLFKLQSIFSLTDTYQGLVIVYATVCIPFTVFVLMGFFTSIPTDIIEAATVDGCNQNRLFWIIAMPLAKPGLIAVTSFNFVWIWNEYLLALVFTSKKSLRTISLGMYALQGSMTYTVDWGALFAGVVIMVVPAAIIFVLLNKYIISGVTVGAVKG